MLAKTDLKTWIIQCGTNEYYLHRRGNENLFTSYLLLPYYGRATFKDLIRDLKKYWGVLPSD